MTQTNTKLTKHEQSGQGVPSAGCSGAQAHRTACAPLQPSRRGFLGLLGLLPGLGLLRPERRRYARGGPVTGVPPFVDRPCGYNLTATSNDSPVYRYVFTDSTGTPSTTWNVWMKTPGQVAECVSRQYGV